MELPMKDHTVSSGGRSMAHRGSYGGGGQGQYPAGQPGYSGGYQQATQDRMSRAQSLSSQTAPPPVQVSPGPSSVHVVCVCPQVQSDCPTPCAGPVRLPHPLCRFPLAPPVFMLFVFVHRSSQTAPPPVQVSPGPSSVVNKFVNDGSFMEQFMRMQKKKTVKREEDKSQGIEPENGTPAADVSAPQTAAAAAAKIAFSGKKATPSSITNFVSHMKRTDKSATSISRPDVFETPEREPEQPRKTISEDLQTREVVEKLAAFVAEGGKQVEEVAIKKNKDNPAFW
ncbi:SURP and G-patch domain-containing protein 1 [Branchiostoma belcheri]|nr:SURP and G-patch domain-containing protein 1 [Branchiostoma belcheri]